MKDGMTDGEAGVGEEFQNIKVYYTGTIPAFSGNTISVASDITTSAGDLTLPGSQYGLTIPVTANDGLTGGDIVWFSGGEALQTGALGAVADGVCLTTTASGGSAPVLVHGVYELAAADTVNAGSYVMAGSAANTVMQASAGEAIAFGTCFKGAASGANALVLVGTI